jgi:crossover junction endodeoxyribonuclease RusA
MMQRPDERLRLLRIVLPFPPSLNNCTAVVKGRKILSSRARAYNRDCRAIIRTSRDWTPISRALAAHVMLVPKDKRRRDAGNFDKAPLDALTRAGIYEDDAQVVRVMSEMMRADADFPRCIVDLYPATQWSCTAIEGFGVYGEFL